MGYEVWIDDLYVDAVDAGDYSNAYRKALELWSDYTNQAAFTPDARGFTLRFRQKEYRFSDSIDVVRGMHLMGSGGSDPGGGTRLLFPYGVDGIIVHHVIPLPAGDVIPGTLALEPHDIMLHARGTAMASLAVPAGHTALLGQGAVIERISLIAMERPLGVSDGYAHGIALRSKATLRDVYVYNFSGNGIDIRGWVPIWNANSWQAQNCLIQRCGIGFYCLGSDVNAGTGIAISCTSNREWGIWDASFLGNTYVGCHCDGNASGAYRSGVSHLGDLRGVSANVFIGCYAEGNSWPMGRVVIKAPSLVIGGMMNPVGHWDEMGISSAEIATDPAAVAEWETYRSTSGNLFTEGYAGVFRYGGAIGRSMPNHVSEPELGRNHAYARIGSDSGPRIAFEFGWTEEGTDSQQEFFSRSVGVYRLAYEHKPAQPAQKGWWSLYAGEGDDVGAPVMLSTAVAIEGRGQLWLQCGYFIGGGALSLNDLGPRPRLRVVTGLTAPESGEWSHGDRVLNAEPSASGWAGWICVASGTPGLWKGFGKIEA